MIQLEIPEIPELFTDDPPPDEAEFRAEVPNAAAPIPAAVARPISLAGDVIFPRQYLQKYHHQ